MADGVGIEGVGAKGCSEGVGSQVMSTGVEVIQHLQIVYIPEERLVLWQMVSAQMELVPKESVQRDGRQGMSTGVEVTQHLHAIYVPGERLAWHSNSKKWMCDHERDPSDPRHHLVVH